MPTVEASRHALFSRLEEVLGHDHAETLMQHLPQHQNDEVATKGDIAEIKGDISALSARFDRFEDRLDRHQRFFVATTFGTLTAMTAIFSFVVTVVT